MKRSLTYRGFFPNALSFNAGFSQTLLQRGALAAAVLAIIAGLFGMHVMTGNHAAHGQHAAAVPVSDGHAQAVYANVLDAGAEHAAAGHLHAVPPDAVHTKGAVHADAAGATSCAGSCHRVQETGAACVPSAKAGALTVFPPLESRLDVAAAPGTRTGPAVAYAHTPSSPTPCELSISRT
ncbi:hypothetical protein PY310_05790 [Pseudarthrobacter sp. H3Y2-7]|uniref:hypothetical protein n=1 Tax=Pseudarthrobacter naphthalenicus TaxID=3031328 RepID=UPI0023B08504|nr:hypothetical protein [Pseudarthrobacter sp. H3Y2-7]MDE8668096.1 hypothetical protein [Pseudarthrobacter sp. H3Y2-7]